MQHIKSLLELLELWLRTLIREEFRNAQQSQQVAGNISTHDRIGGIKLFSEVTGMAEQTGYNLASRREVPFAKRGGKLIFSESELRLWMMENRRPMQKEIVATAHLFVASPRRKGVTK